MQDVSFCAVAERREAKASGKKSALYMRIMKEHGLAIQSTTLNYKIERLDLPTKAVKKP